MTSLERRILYRLRVSDALDVFQLRDLVRANLQDIRDSVRDLKERELVHVSTWHRRPAGKRIRAYSPGAGVNVAKEDVDFGDRAPRVRDETRLTIRKLRLTVDPLTFDPFRVLRAQVGAA